jgi:hypothetical protein
LWRSSLGVVSVRFTIFGLIEPAELSNGVSQLGNLVLHVGLRAVASRRLKGGFFDARADLVQIHAKAHAAAGSADHRTAIFVCD